MLGIEFLSESNSTICSIPSVHSKSDCPTSQRMMTDDVYALCHHSVTLMVPMVQRTVPTVLVVDAQALSVVSYHSKYHRLWVDMVRETVFAVSVVAECTF